MPGDIWMWVLGILISINIGILGFIAKFIKDTYDIATDLDVLLNGTNKEQQGFVAETRAAQQKVADEQEEMRERMQAQARLSEEMTYALREVAEAVDKLNGHDVDHDRLDEAYEKFDDSRSNHDRRSD